MGDPRFPRKKFERPRSPWNTERLEQERVLVKEYGLKNKREIYVAETFLRKKRNSARKLLSFELEERQKREKEILDSLKRLGILGENASLEDVLTLSVKDLLERRLATIAWRKNLSVTIKQARQFVVHGHVAISGVKVDKPSYLVPVIAENNIAYYGEAMVLQEPKRVVPEKEIFEEPTEKDLLKKAFEETAKAADGEKSDASETKEKKASEKEEKPVEVKKEAKPEVKEEAPVEKEEVKEKVTE